MGEESILPRTLEGWVGIVAQTILIFGAVSTIFHKVVVQPLLLDIASARKGYDREISEIKASCTTNGVQIADITKKTQVSEFDRASLRQDLGKLEGAMSRQVQQMEAIRDAAHRDQIEIVERLSRIEANVNVAKAMDSLAEKIVTALKQR